MLLCNIFSIKQYYCVYTYTLAAAHVHVHALQTDVADNCWCSFSSGPSCCHTAQNALSKPVKCHPHNTLTYTTAHHCLDFNLVSAGTFMSSYRVAIRPSSDPAHPAPCAGQPPFTCSPQEGSLAPGASQKVLCNSMYSTSSAEYC